MGAKVLAETGLDLEDSSSVVEVTISDEYDLFTVQPIVMSGSWGAAEVTCQWSLIGGTTAARWSSLDEPLVLTSADEDLITTPRYLGAFRLIRFAVTTDQSGTPGTLGFAVGQDMSFVGRTNAFLASLSPSG